MKGTSEKGTAAAVLRRGPLLWPSRTKKAGTFARLSHLFKNCAPYQSIRIRFASSICGFFSIFGMLTFRMPFSNPALMSDSVTSSPT